MALCWKCRKKVMRKFSENGCIETFWVDIFHCHHPEPPQEPISPCRWCEPGAVLEVTKKGMKVPFNYCPNCGRELH